MWSAGRRSGFWNGPQPRTLLAAGDKVTFAPVSLRECEFLAAQAAAGTLKTRAGRRAGGSGGMSRGCDFYRTGSRSRRRARRLQPALGDKTFGLMRGGTGETFQTEHDHGTVWSRTKSRWRMPTQEYRCDERSRFRVIWRGFLNISRFI